MADVLGATIMERGRYARVGVGIVVCVDCVAAKVTANHSGGGGC